MGLGRQLLEVSFLFNNVSHRTIMGKTLKSISFIAGILFVGGLACFSYLFGTAESRVRHICGQVTPGMSFSALRSFAETNGLSRPYQESGMNFLVETKTFGRWGCKVVLENGAVKNVEFNFSD